MDRNTVIFECSGIGPKVLYSGSLGSKNLSKFSFWVLEIFEILRKSTWKIEMRLMWRTHVTIFERFLAQIDSLDMPELRIEIFEGQMSTGVTWGQIFGFGLKIRLWWLIWAWFTKTRVYMWEYIYLTEQKHCRSQI